MRGKAIILFIFLTCILFMGFSFDKGFNYSRVEKLKWEDLDKTHLEPKIIDLTKKIRSKEVSKEFVEKKELFPFSERWLVKKYDENSLFNTKIDEYGNKSFYLNGKMVFVNVRSFFLDNDNYIGNIFNDKYNNLLALTTLSIDRYSQNNPKPIEVVELERVKYNNKSSLLCDDHRLLDIKGELLFIAGWENEYRVVPMYAYTKLYKFDLKKKQVEVFDSYPYGIFIYGFDVFEGYSPNYDISKDRRYFYIPGVQDHEYSNIAYIFDRENVKVQGGLYVYDWWENRLYKLVDGTVSDVTNNTDDGYVYYKVRIYDKKKREAKEWYYRFKNPEEMLKQITE